MQRNMSSAKSYEKSSFIETLVTLLRNRGREKVSTKAVERKLATKEKKGKNNYKKFRIQLQNQEYQR